MTALRELASELGIELEWYDVDGTLHTVGDETLLATCRALHADVDRPEDAGAALAAHRAERVAARIEPIAPAWDGRVATVTVYRTASQLDTPFEIVIELENGASHVYTRAQCRSREPRPTAVEGVFALVVDVPGPLPVGAHRLTLTGHEVHARATVLTAPTRPRPVGSARRWGLFAPLYAVHDAIRPDAGDLGTLDRFARWADSRGAGVVGVLPILASFVGHGKEPCDPSPYAPVSRRFWNETYVDLHAIDPTVRFDPVVDAAADPVARAARVRAALEPLAVRGAADPSFRTWIASRPDVTAYAQFRARLEGTGAAGAAYHEFAQWCCERQLTALTETMHRRGQSLYLDFPVGSHREGFDVATGDADFVRDASVGAPPDGFYADGQDWGFPPPDPHRARAGGYASLRECLDAHFRFAHDVRIDHVMGLHRLWFIPPGAGARDGAYVRYAADEQWAVLCLAAARRDGTIVGENLGTVPEATNAALDAHGALGMWVLPFETPSGGAVVPPTSAQLACVDTHDVPPFATWWSTLDSARRGVLVDTLRGATAGDLDEHDASSVLGAIFEWLGASAAPLVVAALEDLWLETEPQNRPGTPADQNFRHRGRHGVDELDALVEVDRLLRILDHARARTGAPVDS